MKKTITIEGVELIVSDDGRVWTHRKLKNGKYKTRELTPCMTNSGYLRIKLNAPGIDRPLTIHRLVSKVFIPNPDNLPQVNHIDGNKTNNSVSNLEWCTLSQNMRHAYDTGLYHKKAGRPGKQVMCVETGEVFPSSIEASLATGVSRPYISRSCKTRTHAKGYHFKFI